MGKPRPPVPCCRCGTIEGLARSGKKSPARYRIVGEEMACRKCYDAWRFEPRDADFFARYLLAERRKTEEKIKKAKLDRFLDRMAPHKKTSEHDSVGMQPTRKNVRKIRWLWHRGEAWKLIVRPGLYGAICKESQPGDVSCSGI